MYNSIKSYLLMMIFYTLWSNDWMLFVDWFVIHIESGGREVHRHTRRYGRAIRQLSACEFKSTNCTSTSTKHSKIWWIQSGVLRDQCENYCNSRDIKYLYGAEGQRTRFVSFRIYGKSSRWNAINRWNRSIEMFGIFTSIAFESFILCSIRPLEPC